MIHWYNDADKNEYTGISSIFKFPFYLEFQGKLILRNTVVANQSFFSSSKFQDLVGQTFSRRTKVSQFEVLAVRRLFIIICIISWWVSTHWLSLSNYIKQCKNWPTEISGRPGTVELEGKYEGGTVMMASGLLFPPSCVGWAQCIPRRAGDIVSQQQ